MQLIFWISNAVMAGLDMHKLDRRTHSADQQPIDELTRMHIQNAISDKNLRLMITRHETACT